MSQITPAFDPKAAPAERLALVQKLVRTLSADRLPILVGPFYSELGFEALYWTPFVAWLSKQVPDFAKRAIIVTRGGAGHLYPAMAAQGVDLYALRTVTEVRRASLKEQRKTGLLKQIRETDFDRLVLKDAAKAHGFGLPYHVVHPAWVYWAGEPYWAGAAGVAHLQAMSDFARLPRPSIPLEGLPPQYVAVKFYGRATFPYPNPHVSSFVRRTVATLAAQTPVVVLQSGDAYDDHTDIHVVGDNVLAVGAGVPAHENLGVQATVIGRATAFVGTYGGTAQLALRMGVPSASFWAEFGGTSPQHLFLNQWLGMATKTPFLAGSIDDAHLWGQLTGLPVKALKAAEAHEIGRAHV